MRRTFPPCVNIADGPDMGAEYRQLQASWSSRLGDGAAVLLDGALGTELERRGVPSGLPLWSTQALLEAPEAVAEVEHREHIAQLERAGVDVIAIETMNCVREARVAARVAAAAGVPFWVSFVCGRDACLLSGESLAAAIDAVGGAGPVAVGINCIPVSGVAACLPVLKSSGLDFLVYANLGAPTKAGGRSEDCAPSEFATALERWARAGARMVGGCCGTRPDHIRAASQALTRRGGDK